MSAAHVRSLIIRASTVQDQIRREQSATQPDWVRILRLKKLRVALKDRIVAIALRAAHPPRQPSLAPAAARRRA
jgi:uncharacterized protein YdcH (DUF465 family)